VAAQQQAQSTVNQAPSNAGNNNSSNPTK
jgi:hypothetical protein